MQVEATDQRHKDLAIVDKQQHAFEAFLQYCSLVVRQRAGGVGTDSGFAVLHHDEAVLIILVGNGKCVLTEVVKEAFLGVAVVVEGFVVVNMVAREVGKESAVEIQARDTFLRDGVRRHLHEGVRAAGFYHAAE